MRTFLNSAISFTANLISNVFGVLISIPLTLLVFVSVPFWAISIGVTYFKTKQVKFEYVTLFKAGAYLDWLVFRASKSSAPTHYFDIQVIRLFGFEFTYIP